MNYEKKYKEALEKARQFSEHPLEEDSSSIVEYIFPELKESEDERIRQELITHCRNIRCVTEEGAEGIAKWIAWLEKQGEQKPVWSEEDERNLEGIIDEIEANKNTAPDYDLATYDRFLSWLKSLIQRFN